MVSRTSIPSFGESSHLLGVCAIAVTVVWLACKICPSILYQLEK